MIFHVMYANDSGIKSLGIELCDIHKEKSRRIENTSIDDAETERERGANQSNI